MADDLTMEQIKEGGGEMKSDNFVVCIDYRSQNALCRSSYQKKGPPAYARM